MFVALLIQWNPRFSSRDLLQKSVLELLSTYFQWCHRTQTEQYYQSIECNFGNVIVSVEKMEKAPKYIFNDRKGTSWRCRPASSRRCLRRRKRQRSWSSMLSSTPTSSSLDCYIFFTPGVKLVCFWVNQEEWSPGNNYKNSDKTHYTTKNMWKILLVL